MASMEGHDDQVLVNRKWAHRHPYIAISSNGGQNAGALFATTTTTTTTPPLPPPPTSASLSHSKVGLQTTQPRPVFSPHSSYKRQLPDSSHEIYLPPSNSDLLMGSINTRDQSTMTTPLKDPLDDYLPWPPPQVTGPRLGFIIML